MFDAVTIMVTTEETAFGLQIWDIGFIQIQIHIFL